MEVKGCKSSGARKQHFPITLRESLMMLPGAEHRKYLNGRRNINTQRERLPSRMIAAPSSVGVGGVVVVPFILLLISR